MSQPLNLSLSYLKAAYASGELTPSVVIDHILDRERMFRPNLHVNSWPLQNR